MAQVTSSTAFNLLEISKMFLAFCAASAARSGSSWDFLKALGMEPLTFRWGFLLADRHDIEGEFGGGVLLSNFLQHNGFLGPHYLVTRF